MLHTFPPEEFPTKVISVIQAENALTDFSVLRMKPFTHIVERGSDDLTIGYFPCGFYSGINNPVLQESSRLLGHLLDKGVKESLVAKYSWRWESPRRQALRTAPVPDKWSALGMQHLLVMFIVVLACFGISVITFVAEHCLAPKSGRVV